ncbi:aldose 1-epimerase family protein [Desulfosporosinus sp. PR]|uniref:aldose 1-epimerase family protein n=1 Tax=Candidatus Desulfosporosinus nitrosoreducens TaxID=3401928 RepID=UPI0027EBFC6A|nr:aldose 1-epimerase family protein [Desulfosporosinus sp. PR]MDQ7097098.1 aldose 1-epimerase family protein [Desulfosporosinus sp. PR]
MPVLENEFISVVLEAKGAEIQNLVSKQDQTEYIWQGDLKYWPWHAPICFPIVGKLANDKYYVRNNSYSLPIHGFARDMEFTEIEVSNSQIMYCLDYDKTTLARFPFKFKLVIKYSLLGNGVDIQYIVKNTDDKQIYFSLGAHPGFNCPFSSEEMFSDYELIFDKIEHCLAEDLEELRLQNGNTLKLEHKLFQKGALVFENLQSQFVILKSRKTGKSITVRFENFPYLGIWTKADEAPFICIEPWFGIADRSEESKQISQKEGILSLQPCQEFKCAYQILIAN